MQKARVTVIEEIRGLAFLAIVMQHTLAGFVQGFIETPVLMKAFAHEAGFLLLLIRPAVPLFVFITGLVLFYNYGRDKLDYRLFLKKRFSQIFWPYVGWSLFYFVWTAFLFGRDPLDIINVTGEFAELLLKGEGFYHLWFMIMIIQFYLVFPLFKALLSYCRTKVLITLGVALLIYIGYLCFYQYQIPLLVPGIQSDLLLEILAYRDRLFISWFFYFLLGGFAGLYAGQVAAVVKRIFPACLGIFVVLLGWIFYQIAQTGYYNEVGGYVLDYQLTLPLLPQMVLYISTALVVVYFLVDNQVPKYPRIKQILSVAGSYSFGAYLLHAFVLHYLLKMGKAYWQPWGNLLQVLVVFAATSILSLWGCYLLSKINISAGRLIVGKITG